MLTHILAVLAFIVVSFVVQAGSHFKLNKAHFDGISFARKEPIMWLGVLVMVGQGIILSVGYGLVAPSLPGVWGAVAYALGMGAFLGLYSAVVEPAKYMVPSIGAWMKVEAGASLVQFALYGVLLGFIHQNWPV